MKIQRRANLGRRLGAIIRSGGRKAGKYARRKSCGESRYKIGETYSSGENVV